MPNHDILDLHSETPMVQLRQLSRNIRPAVMAKLEYMNPAFSHYYRVAAAVVRDAEERRLIHPGMTLVDWTYGNSGIALAMAAVSHGYKVLLVAPDKISREKHDVLRALGAELVITPSEALPGESRSCMNVAGNLVNNIPNAFFAGMYDHPLNLEVHRDVTGSEIAAQTDGKVTHVFVPMSSAAMISGIAAALKSTNSGVKIVGVEPVGSVFSALLNDGRPGETSFSELEEIGAQRQPSFWDPSLIDEVVQVSDGEAMNCARELLRSDAVFAGSASGAVMAAALRAGDELDDTACIVAVLSDFGGYYLSKMYRDDWMREKGLYRREKLSLEQITAEDILQLKAPRDLIVAYPENTLAEVFEMMKQNDVSQLPIVSYNAPIGSISENKILSILIENDEAMNSKVVGFMEPPFPVCQTDATISELSEKLQQNAAGVLISLVDGKLQLLTKSDLIDALTHK
ncbi:pyridoxal-phosphate dependent enzyme [Chlorobium phaeovibrioides]|uniref:Pyridoxal-phosphate dependent enzyme n=1 Tax=Chlorobium phaeovibrioides TaxID=1094 RepID=A0ABW9URP5_CHLPH|nr:pyridoxal-phosphate dependent enzyme [Chlorobium phaeovibrioides]MWV54810.1 pyridoxal-phosphate dependent enzyme [Chlorobium phaeovibrioides]QEQ57465.1 pyridoxal-phosphate dependent enzyme [Chlorobium phaeovibrioides]RTY36087.1 pyridoxal-phosphate dependent enzyme [Chlorobium phaeovibrioides]